MNFIKRTFTPFWQIVATVAIFALFLSIILQVNFAQAQTDNTDTGNTNLTTVVAGCTDADATNYSHTANEDDGSCEYYEDIILGCTDVNATNYNLGATDDDYSCTYPDVTFCHVNDADGPDGPFEFMTRDTHDMYLQGHLNPQVYDIIPSFYHEDDNNNGHWHPATNNWEGQESQNFIDNECSEPEPEPTTYYIDGYKWNDSDNLGVWDGPELAIPGWTIEITNGDDVTYSTTTDSDGYYWFEVGNGNWTVSEVQRNGWEQTWPSPKDNGQCQFSFDKTNDLKSKPSCNFGNYEIPQEVPVCEIGDNLLKNGSFEEPEVTNASKWQLFYTVPNWIITKVSDNTSTNLELWLNPFYGGPSDGEQNAELGGTEASQITQTVITIPGALYELKFDFSPRPNRNLADNSINVLVDGVFLMNAQGDGSNITENTWSTHSETFTADTSSTDITLKDIGTDNSYGSLADNAVLCLVQEPDTYIIDGYKWNDENGDGEWGEGEDGVPEWGIVVRPMDIRPFETLYVPAQDAVVSTTGTLTAGRIYLVEASGTYRFGNWGEYGIADTEWAYRNDAWTDNPLLPHGWTKGEYTYSGAPNAVGLDLQIDSQNIEWGSFNEDHLYKTIVIGDGTGLDFFIKDSAYGDNEGGLDVEIYDVTDYVNYTDPDGYYSVEVDEGSYQVVEIMQDGWNQTYPSGPSYYHVNVPNDNQGGYDFGNKGPEDDNGGGDDDHNGEIHGTKYDWSSENPLSGWEIELWHDDEIISTITTMIDNPETEENEDGMYWFVNLEEDEDYKVCEVQQEGWTQVTPDGDGCYAIDDLEGIETGKDFWNQEEEESNNSGDGGGSSSGTRVTPSPTPEVLGAAISASERCGVYLLDYMRIGQENSPYEVMKLQAFLVGQGYFNVSINGVFDSATNEAVHALQTKATDEILVPWDEEAGIFPSQQSSTGYVYKTTRWYINNIVCPGSEQFPERLL